MPSIDERVVSMAFENHVFEQRVAQTLSTLAKLDNAISKIGHTNGLMDIEKAANKVTLQQPMSALDKLKARFSNAGSGAAQGFSDIERAGSKVQLTEPIRALNRVQNSVANVSRDAVGQFSAIENAADKVTFGGMTSALNNLGNKFTVLKGTAAVALGGIASSAAQKGASFAKSFSFGPIMQGFEEYQTNLGSIQTIMANTEGQRISGLDETNKHLQELNHYSDQTIYNFSEMAKNIGTFTAAGVDLDKSTQSIKGIANLAALSGSSSLQASSAMVQLSQAIASGKVGLQDWNSVVYAGMGGKKFQDSLIRTGVAMGTIEKGAVKIDKATGKATINGETFRNSIMSKPGKESWLTSEVLTGSLEQFTGDLSDAQLKAKGFTDEQIKAIQMTAKSAKDAATQVKTLPQVFAVAKETIGSGWSLTFQNIFGDFKESKKLFTGMSQSLNGFINKQANARNKMLAEWKKLGGRDLLVGGLKQGFKDLMLLIKPVTQAFRDIFPRKTGKDLFDITKGFADLMKRLQPSAQTVENLRRTFRGLFAILSIGWYVVKKVAGVLFDLLGFAGKGSGGILKFTGSVGDMLTALKKAIVDGDALGGVFKTITNVLRIPIELVKALASAFFGLFKGVDGKRVKGVGKAFEGMSDSLKPFQKIVNGVRAAWQKLGDILGSIKRFLTPIVQNIADIFGDIATPIADALKNADFDKVMTVLNTTLFGGLVLTIKKAFGKGILSGNTFNTTIGSFRELNKVFGALTGNLTALQHNIQANTLLQIALAIGILAAGVKVLSTIDPKALGRAMVAIAVGLGQLVGALTLLTIVVSKGGVGSLSLIGVAASLILLAGSVVILAAAMKIFATMSWEEIGKGLAGVAGSLGAVTLALKFMDPSGMIRIGLGLMAIAGAMTIMAIAMKIMSSMSWEELGKGMASIAASLGIILGAFTLLPPEKMIAAGLGIGAVAFGLTILSGAVGAFGSMDLETIGKGLVAIGLALFELTVATEVIPDGREMAIKAAGLLLMAIALNGIATAVKSMGGMKPEQIVRGLAGLGAGLAELVIALNLMEGTIAGSAALLLAAGALAILAPTLAFLGSLEWETIGKGLAAMAGMLLVFGVAGALGAEAIGALAIALLPLGLALLAAGAGMLFLAKAMQILVEVGTQGISLMLTGLTALMSLIPDLAVKFAEAVVRAIAEVAKLMPSLSASFITIVESLVQVIITTAPRIATAIGIVIDALLVILVQNYPKFLAAGYALLLSFLRGLDQNINAITTRVTSIVSKFLTAMSDRMPLLSAAGAKFLLSILDGIAQHIGDLVAAGGRIVVKLYNAVLPIVQKVGSFGPKAIAAFIRGLTNGLDDLVRAGARLIINTLDGVSSKFKDIAAAATRFVVRFFNALGNRENVRKMVNAGFKCAINILHGIADGIRDDKNLEEVIRAAADIGKAILDAILGAIKNLPGAIKDKVVGGVKGAFGATTDFLGIGSPSKKFKGVGKNITAGLSNGLDGLREMLKNKIEKPIQSVVAGAKKLTKEKSPSKVFLDIGLNIVNGMAIGLTGMPGVLEGGVTQPIAAMLARTKGLRDFKKFLSSEFKEGLFGGLFTTDNRSEAQKQIDGAFDALKLKLTENHKALRTKITEEQNKLEELLNDPKKNGRAIDRIRATIAEDQRTLALSQFRSRSLMAQLEDEKTALGQLAEQYDLVSRQLEKSKEIFNSFDQLPDVSALFDEAMSTEVGKLPTTYEGWQEFRKQADEKANEEQKKRNIDQVANYKKALAEQILATQKYTETLKQLRDLGLDDQTYQKLLDMGLKGQDFASQLLGKGKAGIDEINKLDAELAKSAIKIADTAAQELIKAGKEAADGFISGLQAKQNEIKTMMEFIANTMIKSLKFRLGIRSPSRVFAEMGQYSVQGLVDGLSSSTSAVQDAATSLGTEASSAVKSALSDIQNGVDSDLTITPVLDLTQVEKDAGRIQDLTNVTPITAAASYGQAAAISDTQKAVTAEADSTPKVIEFNFEQNNTSPKALDEVEVYRNTRNQLSQVKSALGLPT